MTNSLRRPLLAGNWKMNTTLQQGVDLAKALVDAAKAHADRDVAVCVPFTAITVIAKTLEGTPIKVGAQDVYWEASGAYTGEVSTEMLKDAGAKMAIIGHSERRRLFGDTDEWINKKTRAALKAGLIPIMCVGETLEEREAQRTFKVLETQLKGGLAGFAPADLAPLVIAYEPVWAIGTGKTATPQQAQEAHLFIRKQCAGLYGEGFASGVRILYGGSVTDANVDQLMAEPDLDGALVGGASLKAASFNRIISFNKK